MKGPILGILTILLFQLGFIAYTRVDSILDSTADIGPIQTPGVSLPTISDIDLVETDRTDIETAHTASTSLPVSIRDGHFVAVRRTSRKLPAVRTFETDLAPIAIRVPKSVPYVFASYERPPTASRQIEYPGTAAPTLSGMQDTTIRVNTVERKKRRGIASKTFAVIRKPFDWMKTIGSKLK